MSVNHFIIENSWFQSLLHSFRSSLAILFHPIYTYDALKYRTHLIIFYSFLCIWMYLVCFFFSPQIQLASRLNTISFPSIVGQLYAKHGPMWRYYIGDTRNGTYTHKNIELTRFSWFTILVQLFFFVHFTRLVPIQFANLP